MNNTYSNLYVKNNYVNPNLTFIKNTIIVEYDMVSAGLNILTQIGYFTISERDKLLRMDKLKRNILIGNLLKKNKKMVIDLENGFIEARRIFFEKNNIQDYDIISIKRDAIFIIGNKNIDNNITDLIKVKPKNKYTSYINIMNKEHYYNNDTDVLDVKGYSNGIIENHNDFLFKDLKEILMYEERNEKEEIFKKLAILKDNLISYNLPKEYYMDIIRGSYLIVSDKYTYYTLPEISESDIRLGIISYYNNLQFLHELIKVLL